MCACVVKYVFALMAEAVLDHQDMSYRDDISKIILTIRMMNYFKTVFPKIKGEGANRRDR